MQGGVFAGNPAFFHVCFCQLADTRHFSAPIRRRTWHPARPAAGRSPIRAQPDPGAITGTGPGRNGTGRQTGRRGGAARRGEGGHLAPGPHPSPSGGNQNPVAGLLRSRDFWKGQNPARFPAGGPDPAPTGGQEGGQGGAAGRLDQGELDQGNRAGGPRSGASRAGCNAKSYRAIRARGNGAGWKRHHALPQARAAPAPRRGLQSERITANITT